MMGKYNMAQTSLNQTGPSLSSAPKDNFEKEIDWGVKLTTDLLKYCM